MKILITTDWYRPVINGVVTSVLNLTEQLEKRGHEVKVLTLSRNCHSYKEENVIYAGSVGMGKIYPQARVKIPVVAREYMEELLWYQKSVQKNIKLVLVGDGPYRTTLEEKAKEYQVTDSVIFTGMVSPDEVARYYQIGDLFVSASTSETQGMTYDEALAGGVPLLCRKDDCLKEVVTEGKNGWQYENESMYLECIQKWKEFSEDEKRRMRNTAVRTADQFSKESFAKRVERVYLAALEERKRRNVYAA